MEEEPKKPPRYRSIKVDSNSYDGLRLIAAVQGKTIIRIIKEWVTAARKRLKI